MVSLSRLWFHFRMKPNETIWNRINMINCCHKSNRISGCFFYFLKAELAGFAAARSHCGSDSPSGCHSPSSRRFAAPEIRVLVGAISWRFKSSCPNKTIGFPVAFQNNGKTQTYSNMFQSFLHRNHSRDFKITHVLYSVVYLLFSSRFAYENMHPISV